MFSIIIEQAVRLSMGYNALSNQMHRFTGSNFNDTYLGPLVVVSNCNKGNVWLDAVLVVPCTRCCYLSGWSDKKYKKENFILDLSISTELL